MKYIFIYLIVFTFLYSCNKNNSINNLKHQEITHQSNTQNDSLSFLEIKPKKIILGDINKKTQKNIKRIVELSNKGKVPIIIHKVDISCGCIKTKLTKNIILQNETIKMEINVHSKNNKGYFNKAIFIKSTASNNLDLIRIQANFID